HSTASARQDRSQCRITSTMVAAVLGLAAVLAQAPAASPTPSASPVPSVSPRVLGLQVTGTFAATFLDQNTSGPGQVGPEAVSFLNISPLAPNTPYDTFSTAPLTPGVAGIAQALTTLTERTKTLDIGLDTGAGIRRRQHHERSVLG